MPEMNPFLSVFIISIIITITLEECRCCPDNHKEALLEFKSLLLGNTTSTSHKYLAGFETWNSTTNCCKWDIIVCDDASQHVTEFSISRVISMYLDLVVSSDVLTPLFRIQTLTHFDVSSNGIQGEFPAVGISNLTNLVTLDMSENNFNGTIPLSFLPSKHLEFLSLSYNSIQGKLGTNFFLLSNLSSLQLQENFFHGDIPSEIGNLTRLQHLNLRNNEFSGSIPSSLFSLRELTWLELISNSLSMEIPAEMSNLSSIQHLLLSGNNLSGKIPSSIQKLGQLVSLDLEDNFLVGEIPTWLFDWRNLTQLKLGGNELFLKNASIGPKSKLFRLSLRSCNISGNIPTWLSNQTELYELDLSDNGFTGTFPEQLIEINPSLRSLFLSDNKLSGTIPPLLFNSSCIQNLDLSRNNFSGYLPDNMGELGCLRTLMLSSNDFSGPIPKSLSLTSLFTLDLSKNRFSGSEFPKFESLYTLDLSFNNFSGEIPRNFSDQLIVLVLSQNHFSGNLPRKLASLVNLKCLDLHDNNLTGKVPSFLAQIPSLQILNLRNNSFEGLIPENISNLTLIQILDLSHNKLSGNIPANVGKLHGMIGYHQDLSYKAISYLGRSTSEVQISYPDLEVIWKALKRNLPNQNLGEIPQTLGKLLQLSNLELRNNNLTGRIPSGPQMDRFNNPESYANNSGLCGMQIQVSCDKETHGKKPEENGDEENVETWWFSWMMAGIGFPSGLISTVLVMYIIGFFNLAPKRHKRRYYMRRGGVVSL
ncbi:receptor like protein 46 [Euphorbia peplus]|nr:receptor like protein 46 [Euphorbia peplus]